MAWTDAGVTVSSKRLLDVQIIISRGLKVPWLRSERLLSLLFCPGWPGAWSTEGDTERRERLASPETEASR